MNRENNKFWEQHFNFSRVVEKTSFIASLKPAFIQILFFVLEYWANFPEDTPMGYVSKIHNYRMSGYANVYIFH